MTAPTAPGADGRRVSDDELADYVSNIGVGGYTQTEGRQFILDLCDARSTIAELRGEVERLMADLDTERTAREKTQQKFALLQAAMSDENWRELTSENDQLSKALSAANARIRELEAQRGGQVTEEGIEAVLGAANPLWFWIKSNQSVVAESLRARVRKALATDPAPAGAEQDGEGRS